MLPSGHSAFVWGWVRARRWWHWVVLVFSVLFVVDVISALLGGGSIDPTDPSNFDHFALINDTGAQVTVEPCARPKCGTDGSLLGNGTLPPGGRVSVSV